MGLFRSKSRTRLSGAERKAAEAEVAPPVPSLPIDFPSPILLPATYSSCVVQPSHAAAGRVPPAVATQTLTPHPPSSFESCESHPPTPLRPRANRVHRIKRKPVPAFLYLELAREGIHIDELGQAHYDIDGPPDSPRSSTKSFGASSYESENLDSSSDSGSPSSSSSHESGKAGVSYFGLPSFLPVVAGGLSDAIKVLPSRQHRDSHCSSDSSDADDLVSYGSPSPSSCGDSFEPSMRPASLFSVSSILKPCRVSVGGQMLYLTAPAAFDDGGLSCREMVDEDDDGDEDILHIRMPMPVLSSC